MAGRLAGGRATRSGRPPTVVVFVGKLTTTAAAWDGGHAWLAVLVFVNTVISLFYYLRWIAPAFGRTEQSEPPNAAPSRRGRWSAATALIAAVLSLVFGLGSGVHYGRLDQLNRIGAVMSERLYVARR